MKKLLLFWAIAYHTGLFNNTDNHVGWYILNSTSLEIIYIQSTIDGPSDFLPVSLNSIFTPNTLDLEFAKVKPLSEKESADVILDTTNYWIENISCGEPTTLCAPITDYFNGYHFSMPGQCAYACEYILQASLAKKFLCF